MEYNFEWDPVKARSNVKKHKINFERAAEVFHDAFMLSIFDDYHSKYEERWITFGNDKNNVTIVVVHTFKQTDAHNCAVRIISARRAVRNEVKQYNTRSNEKGIRFLKRGSW